MPAKACINRWMKKMVYYGTSLTDGESEETATLNGRGNDLYFEGEFGCFGADGIVVYGLAFSVFRVEEVPDPCC